MMVGTMRIVTVCYRLVRLVARRALPRHVPVARHFKLVVSGVRADDLASPVHVCVIFAKCLSHAKITARENFTVYSIMKTGTKYTVEMFSSHKFMIILIIIRGFKPLLKIHKKF